MIVAMLPQPADMAAVPAAEWSDGEIEHAWQEALQLTSASTDQEFLRRRLADCRRALGLAADLRTTAQNPCPRP